ncbi:MAG: VOC family protein [Planctomycetota bacterium]|jgi:catechol 2,3-dioxygenase-like lactoylglutathione lyase family enzyme
MIQGVHAMFYTTDAEATRAFIRDKLRLPSHDVGDGWLIFDAPEVEVGCHPSEKRFHGVSFYCDDIEATMAELKERGVEFKSPVKDAGYGLVTMFAVPGAGDVELYQPKYKKG